MVLRGDLRLSDASWCVGYILGGEPSGAGTDIAGAPQRRLLFSSLDTGKATFLEPSELGGTVLLVEAGNDIWNLAGVLWRWRLLLSLSQL